MRRAAIREGTESNFSSGVLSLTESGTVLRTLEDLAVEVNGGLEPRRVVWTFSYTSVRREIEAAPLRELLQLILVHFFLLLISCLQIWKLLQINQSFGF